MAGVDQPTTQYPDHTQWGYPIKSNPKKYAATNDIIMPQVAVHLGLMPRNFAQLKHEEIKMANEGYHEPINELTDETRDMHRAITSLMEELEAIDWYNQRVDACKDNELKAILAHNRDEEKEHAAMVLEWIRRKDRTFDKELKDYLFTEKSITHE